MDVATSSLMDAIRGASAIVVACVHAYQVFVLPYFGMGSQSQIFSSLLATYAVNMFFIVSGLMICLSTLGHRNADGSFRSTEFAIARLLRIYPPLIAAILVTVAVYWGIHLFGLHGAESFRLGGEHFVARERANIEWAALPSTLLLWYGAVPFAPPPLSMDGPLWTLSYEWWFYVLTFLSARLWNGRSLSTTLPLSAVVIMLLIGRNTLFLWFLIIWLAGFCLGCAYVKGKLQSKKYWPAIVALTSTSIGALFLLGGKDLSQDLLRPFDTSPAQRTMVVVSVLVALIVSVLIRSVAHSKFRVPRSITKSAQFSYSLYIIHYPLLLLGFSLFHPLLHTFGWMPSLFAAIAVLVPIVYLASRISLIVENRSLLRRLVTRSATKPLNDSKELSADLRPLRRSAAEPGAKLGA
jgi:peptidoglycan/LPS O-acetylase OafA/YrhL